MKKTYLKMLSSLLITILLVVGCKKELKETNTETDLQTAEAKRNHKKECRLVSNISEFGEQTYTYNHRGLVDEEHFDYIENGKLKMEYDGRGRLVKSRFYSGEVLLNKIVFFYWGDRLVKEIWYDGDTQVKADEVFHFYNRNGKVWKSQSYIGDYTSVYKYTPDGDNVEGWKFYIGGKINYEQKFTYLRPHHRNPSLARPGLVYDFLSGNGWWGQGRWYSTSEKDISYDENGENPEVLLDQDPLKSIVSFNSHNYVTATDFFDILTREYVHFRFGYENCDGNDGDKIQPVQKISPAGNRKNNLLQLLKRGSAKSIKEQVKEWRKQLKDIQTRKVILK